MESNVTPKPNSASASETPAFDSVLCGIDGSRASLEAARQAGILARGGSLRLLAITWEQGTGATAMAALSRWRAEECLTRALQELRELGIRPRAELISDPDATKRLLREAEQHDVLVIGIHGRSRPGGILTGSTASAALHRASVPVLVARRPPTARRFPDRIMLALDGTAPSRVAARVAARIAARHGSEVAVVVGGDSDRSRRHAIAEDLAAVFAATGTEPVVVDERGPAHLAIVAAAAHAGSSLVVTGSRGLAGPLALKSVSERVAHEAQCSVLVAGTHGEHG